MKHPNKGFVMPIVLVFLVISQLVYIGILQITQMETRHVTILQEHYQRNIQTHFTTKMIDEHLENQFPTIGQQMFHEIDTFKHQLLFGIDQSYPVLPFNDQFGSFYIEGDSPDQDLIYVFSISLISPENLVYENITGLPQISFVDEEEYYQNKFHDKLLSNTETSINDLFQQLQQLEWDEIECFETTKILNWTASNLPLTNLRFNSGNSEIHTQQGHFIITSYLDDNDQPYTTPLVIPSINYRLYGQLWTFSPRVLETDLP